MKKLSLAVSVSLLLPLIASAQALQPIVNIVVSLRNIVNLLLPIVIAIALLVFFWGLVKYIRSSGKGHAEGRNIMIAGLVSLFVMVSVWGIVHLAQGALGVNPGDKTETAPTVGGGPAGANAGSQQNFNDPRLYGQWQP